MKIYIIGQESSGNDGYDKICAWCGRIMERNVKGLKGPSHGICDECLKRQFGDGEGGEE